MILHTILSTISKIRWERIKRIYVIF